MTTTISPRHKTFMMKVSDVKFKPRQRKDMNSEEFVEYIADLGDSMEKRGQFHPIIVDNEDFLIMGNCRTLAAIGKSWSHIEAKRWEDVSPAELKQMELEENIRRRNLSWQEEADAIEEIDRLKRTELGEDNWNREMTAELVGRSRQTVYNAIHLVEAAKIDPTIREAETLTGALKKFETRQRIERRKREVELRKDSSIPGPQVEIILGDAAELIKDVPDETFDMILTNPPFGVDLKIGDDQHSVYHDEEDYVTDLVMGLCKEWHRTLKNNSWLVSFFDMRKITYNSYMERFYREAVTFNSISEEGQKCLRRMMGMAFWLEEAGFDKVTVLPQVWVKPNKTQGMIGNPETGFIVAYEAFVFAAKGQPVLLRPGHQNIWIYDTPWASERVHELQMPTDLCRDLVEMCVPAPGALVHDSFAGSGATGLGALARQCDYVGFELDPEKAVRGNMRLLEWLQGHKEDADDEG